ncbi:conserved hypothetical protein [Nostocoides japonicum T1-X7]|uniref:DUF5063 domain-containing protein n=1 Tax=Nostocoides japonicum T1-X7 TaxID=1194083 RepID=A0A077M1V5_9MICO|nr:conserved hypothetical protein [Tetrasphaera japonica T1-X7]
MLADLAPLADECAREARLYLTAVTEIAAGSASDSAIPLSLLALSQALAMGARLGAMEDIVPTDRFEADSGPDPELNPLRVGIANVFEGLDEYADLEDPLTSGEVTTGSLSNDLTLVADGLSHGLAHYDAGRTVEALWWWQFSYLSFWGERAASALRVLQSLLAHIRLDADEEIVSEAEFDALHP